MFLLSTVGENAQEKLNPCLCHRALGYLVLNKALNYFYEAKRTVKIFTLVKLLNEESANEDLKVTRNGKGLMTWRKVKSKFTICSIAVM